MRVTRWQDAIVLAGGAALVLSYAPFAFYPLAFIFPAILFYFWSKATSARAAWLGFLFGLGMFGAGASWVYVSIHEFGFMPAPLAALLVFLFVVYLALFPALAGWLQARALPPGVYRLLFAAPVFWVLMEWLRGWLMTGFPWLHLGYSQSNSLLMSLAPLIGVYGMSLVAGILAALLASMFIFKGACRLLAAGLIAVIFILAWAVDDLQFVEPAGAKVDIALLQGNVPLNEKWKPGAAHQIISYYVSLSREVVDENAIIVWPEGAVPDSWQHVSSWIGLSLPRRKDDSMPDYLIGSIDSSPDGRYYNAAIGIRDINNNKEPAGAFYRKQHLVPFGEFLPFKPVFGWLIDYLKIPMSDFSSWQAVQPAMALAGWPVAVSICYEDAFGEELAKTVRGSAFLVNISEDAWFGDSLAPYQKIADGAGASARIRALFRQGGKYWDHCGNK